jgi:hypothetical protein
MTLLEACDLKVYDLDNKVCSGPNYSFHSEGVCKSYIDQCINCIVSITCQRQLRSRHQLLYNFEKHVVEVIEKGYNDLVSEIHKPQVCCPIQYLSHTVSHIGMIV